MIKTLYLCNRFERETPLEATKKGSEKFLKKSFEKIWWFEKKVLPLHHFPLKNKAVGTGEG